MSQFSENIQDVDDRNGLLHFLEIISPADTTVFRIVDDNVDHTFGGNVFSAYPFKFRKPPDTGDGYSEALLEIDNVGLDFMADIEALGPNQMLRANVIVSSRNTPNVAVHSFRLPLTNITATQQTITARCGYKYLASQQAVKRRMSAFYAPGAN